jgi:hypothetical protein
MERNIFENKNNNLELSPRRGEAVDQYLGRMFINKDTDADTVSAVFRNVRELEKTCYPIPTDVQTKMLDIFDDSQNTLGFSDKLSFKNSKIDLFKQTANRRRFVGPTDSLYKPLFKIYDQENPEIKKYLKEHIDDKVIVLFGGGNSAKDLISGTDFNPKALINIDPYVVEDSWDESNKKEKYTSIKLPSESKELSDMIQKNEIPQADEVWATYSVPMYLESEEKIFDTFKNMDAVLKNGGMIRITPLYLHVFGESLVAENFKEDSPERRWWAFSKSVRDFVESGKYSASISGDTLFLKKLLLPKIKD